MRVLMLLMLTGCNPCQSNQAYYQGYCVDVIVINRLPIDGGSDLDTD